MTTQKPYIVKFENQTSTYDFDVVINCEDCSKATEWARGYFGSVEYLHSDFDGNHTYHRSKQVWE